jgi:hypothetical protein
MELDMLKEKRDFQTIKLFDMEMVSVKGFCDFLRNNIPMVIAVTATLFFTYGIKLFWYSIGLDIELFMADKPTFLKWHSQIGRFGLTLLSSLWYIKEFNPFTAFFTAFCLVWFFTLFWCYIIAVFGKNTARNNRLIPFALLFMASPVWAEQFYFTFQSAETSFMIFLCPYVIYLLYKGFLDNEKGKIIAAFILLVFMTSVYQAIVPLFCCGVFACFMLLQEHSDYEPKIYRSLCLKLFITLIAALAVYFFVDRIIVPFIFHIEKSDYVDKMNQWGRRPILKSIGSILVFGYTVTIGGFPPMQSVATPLIARYARSGMETAKIIANISKECGNILLLPAAVLFLIKTVKIARRKIPAGRRLLYMLACIGVPLCIMLLAIAGGNNPPIRSLWALPFASAFMVYFLIKTWKKRAAAVLCCLALLAAARQMEITAQLFYSDQVRYNEDVRLAYDINKMIIPLQNETNSLPVALIGRYKADSLFKANFLQGEVFGHSIFEWANTPADTTKRGLAFMSALGMHFDAANDTLLLQAVQAAETVPSYPAPGCAVRLPGVIVVRLSDTPYPPVLE